ncbi:MAG TPA: prenyltransferase/squalene oxidase repeat-containing protein [Tepidisphaeraceae bacterium]|jgi:prenyltransferase beta subunit|nr:prenyltransferase/squalene oxidase repeat-containing protein [Tepidisphaeraceae bacterium]
MLQVARLAPKLLGEATDLVADFLRGQLNDDGGFKNRAGASDIYYTVFGLEGLLALRADLPHAKVAAYLQTLAPVDTLDLVHVCSLARCWANLPAPMRDQAPRDDMARRIESFRSADGGFNTLARAPSGTVYGCFLAAAGYGDAGIEMPNASAMLDCIRPLRAADGGYANQQDMPIGLVPSTAAAVTLLRHLSQPPDARLGDWLLACCRPEGGFFPTPHSPIPDLLSTATALHALAGMQVDIEAIQEPCLDFVDSLWTKKGGFFGNWSDDMLDAEYTYYGLLALGHLSL